MGNMYNIRHFWSSIRPNGPQRPHVLDRLELRICDYISDIELLLAITALLELRVIYLFENLKTLDPLNTSKFSICLLYTSPSPRDKSSSRMPSSA